MFASVEPSASKRHTYSFIEVEAFESDSDMARSKVVPLAKGKLKSLYGKHYWTVFLWSSQKDYETSAEVDVPDTAAMCITHTHRNLNDGSFYVKPKLGALHFVSGHWDLNTAFHEVTHAILHRMRHLHPTPAMVLDDMSDAYDPEDEEIIAYEAGSWGEAVISWLTNMDPESPYPKSLFDR